MNQAVPKVLAVALAFAVRWVPSPSLAVLFRGRFRLAFLHVHACWVMLPKHGGSFLSVCCCSPRAGSISVVMSRDSPGVTAALRAGASVWRPSYDRGSFVCASRGAAARTGWAASRRLTQIATKIGVLRVSPVHLPRPLLPGPLPEPSNGVCAVARIGAAGHAAILIGDGAATAPPIGTIPPPGIIVSRLIS